MTALHFLLYGLACWRLAMLLSIDSGPAKIFQRFRSFLKREEKKSPALRKSDVAHGIDCLRCSSVWVALPVAAWVQCREGAPGWAVLAGDGFLLWMALSAMAILWNRAFPAA